MAFSERWCKSSRPSGPQFPFPPPLPRPSFYQALLTLPIYTPGSGWREALRVQSLAKKQNSMTTARTRTRTARSGIQDANHWTIGSPKALMKGRLSKETCDLLTSFSLSTVITQWVIHVLDVVPTVVTMNWTRSYLVYLFHRSCWNRGTMEFMSLSRSDQ